MTSAFRYLERYSRILQCGDFTFLLSQYALELSLIEVCMNRYSPEV